MQGLISGIGACVDTPYGEDYQHFSPGWFVKEVVVKEDNKFPGKRTYFDYSADGKKWFVAYVGGETTIPVGDVTAIRAEYDKPVPIADHPEAAGYVWVYRHPDPESEHGYNYTYTAGRAPKELLPIKFRHSNLVGVIAVRADKSEIGYVTPPIAPQPTLEWLIIERGIGMTYPILDGFGYNDARAKAANGGSMNEWIRNVPDNQLQLILDAVKVRYSLMSNVPSLADDNYGRHRTALGDLLDVVKKECVLRGFIRGDER